MGVVQLIVGVVQLVLRVVQLVVLVVWLLMLVSWMLGIVEIMAEAVISLAAEFSFVISPMGHSGTAPMGFSSAASTVQSGTFLLFSSSCVSGSRGFQVDKIVINLK